MTGANRTMDPARTTGALGAVTGAMRTTGGLPATGAMRANGVLRTTGAMRTAKPIAPGTGKARIVLPIVVLAVIALGFAGVGYLWWKNTLFMHTPGAVLIDIGEILGLLSGYGVVVLVALMSRLPPLEKGIGTDRLALLALHRRSPQSFSDWRRIPGENVVYGRVILGSVGSRR